MKKCPTCGKTFEDSMRFCQADGTPLVDDVAAAAEPEAPAVEEPAFDPYATIVGVPKSVPVAEPAEAASGGEVVLEPAVDPEPPMAPTAGSIPVTEPDDVLEVPGVDP